MVVTAGLELFQDTVVPSAVVRLGIQTCQTLSCLLHFRCKSSCKGTTERYASLPYTTRWWLNHPNLAAVVVVVVAAVVVAVVVVAVVEVVFTKNERGGKVGDTGSSGLGGGGLLGFEVGGSVLEEGVEILLECHAG